jgi:aminoglycoside phosphotransferase (APT) family kinase protein
LRSHRTLVQQPGHYNTEIVELHSAHTLHLLKSAAEVNGLDCTDPRLIRNGSHAMWIIASDIVARVGEAGTEPGAAREVAVSTWLDGNGIRTTRTVDGLEQPTMVESHPVTWWRLLPPHRPAEPGELGEALRELHTLPVPHHLHLPEFAPAAGVRERLASSDSDSVDSDWVLGRLEILAAEYSKIRDTLPVGVMHGDAWQGNFAIVDEGKPVILDLESFSVGPKWWDLIPVAADFTDFDRISGDQYHDFLSAYGFDVTTTASYRTLADMQELRWTSFVAGKSQHSSTAAAEARYRIACLKGEVARPWTWKPF